jgi:hypothetical protein
MLISSKGEKPELKEFTGESITVKSMWAQFDQLTIIDDVLVRRLEGLSTKLHVIYLEASFVSRTNNLLHITLHPFANLANNTPV